MKFLPSLKYASLALASAGLLILAFPDFELWWTAWFALVPLMWAVERETERGHSCPHEPAGRSDPDVSTLSRASRSWGQECPRSFILGWLFGTVFFFGTCWWLAYAPIHYASIPWPLAYFLIFIPCVISGIFPGIFAAILAGLLRRFGSWAFLAAPFVWVFTEFARYWIAGNNWNAIGYSQFDTRISLGGSIGGVLYVTGIVVVANSCFLFLAKTQLLRKIEKEFRFATAFLLIAISGVISLPVLYYGQTASPKNDLAVRVIALQPNVPMSGVDYSKLQQSRQRQFELAEVEIKGLRTTSNELPTVVILPESPMNFMYNDDREFQQFVRDFTTRNNVSLLFNSAEPDPTNGKYFNSAVMVNEQGNEVAQYDKIYLLPFGEAVPVPLETLVPAFVGNFSYGREYDLLPLGDAKAGVMICFESHFGQLSREYVRNGADAIIEMTNDGYLGPTPVLRQHLANAVFRAVETNRPVLRVTNVGITAYIDERGQVHDSLPPYSEGTRVWTVAKSDGSQTFYVKYGDWFAWLCTAITFGLLIICVRRRPEAATADSFGRK